jgi:hypothetical protein
MRRTFRKQAMPPTGPRRAKQPYYNILQEKGKGQFFLFIMPVFTFAE